MDPKKLREFGYVCFGPVVLHFAKWLARSAKEREIDALYFLAREGHFLMATFERYRALFEPDAPPMSPIPCRYLLTSRRALFGAAPKTRSSLLTMLEAGVYEGSLQALLRARLGDGAARLLTRDRSIELPRDTKKVLAQLLEGLPSLNDAADAERAGLVKYLNEVELTRASHVGLVDLGYSGSIQRFLQPIAGVRMTGFYLSTTKRVNEWRTERNDALGCFGEDCAFDSLVPVFRHSLLLEAWLTSPDPQLVRFDAEGRPVFAERSAMQRRFAELEVITAGVLDYFDDVAQLGAARDDQSWFAQDVMVKALFAPQYAEVVSMLSVEDRFCGNAEIEVARRYEAS